jgi:enoyl-CoA hydratase
MLTGDSLSVGEAYDLGMVSKIFHDDELEEKTLEFAERIARVPTMTALLVKECVNQTQDQRGFFTALQSCFTLHQLNHAHWAEINEDGSPVASMDWRSAPEIRPARKNAVH